LAIFDALAKASAILASSPAARNFFAAFSYFIFSFKAFPSLSIFAFYALIASSRILLFSTCFSCYIFSSTANSKSSLSFSA